MVVHRRKPRKRSGGLSSLASFASVEKRAASGCRQGTVFTAPMKKGDKSLNRRKTEETEQKMTHLRSSAGTCLLPFARHLGGAATPPYRHSWFCREAE
jgi:hypothetical protein